MAWVLGILLSLLLVIATTVGVHVMPWSAWWFATTDVGSIPIGNLPPGAEPPPTTGRVTDLQRYGLARAAGFNPQDAITATAISIAEDGSGDPAALSPPNKDGSVDFCLWQVNSAWHSQFGGQAALAVPINCARAAYVIYGKQGFCAWSTWEVSCGPGHTGNYRAYLSRARAASQAQPSPEQA